MQRRRAVLYLRISDDKGGHSAGVSRQRAACMELAGTLGFNVVGDYSDASKSATRGVRPEFERLLDAARAGQFDAIVCWHLDRLYRRMRDLQRLVEVVQPRGITVHQVQAGHPLDLSTPSGLMQANITAAVSQYEVQHKIERQRAETRQRLLDGRRPAGGPRPFGYETLPGGDLRPHPVEAQMVLDATMHVLSGGSIGSIVRDWNQRGVATTRGRQWGYTSMRALLMRWSSAGIRQHTVVDSVTGAKDVREHGPGTWPAIVPEPEFRALRSLLSDPARARHGGRTARRHLLSNILLCEVCGSGLRAARVVTRAGKEHWTYQCPGQRTSCRLSIDYETAERVVVTAVLNRLARPSKRMLAVTDEDRTRQADLHARLTTVSSDEDAVENSSMSVPRKVSMLEGLQAQRAALQSELDGFTRRSQLSALVNELSENGTGVEMAAEGWRNRVEVERRFHALDLDRRRAVVRSLVHVSVIPATSGVRPTKATAAERLLVNYVDLDTGEPMPLFGWQGRGGRS